MTLTVGSLFAGVGGFDLGAERAGLEVRWQVEIDPFCRAVLAKHWPNVRRYEDVRRCYGVDRQTCAELGEVDWDAERDTHEDRGYPPLANSTDGVDGPYWTEPLEYVDVLCGGFPCQDISYAGDGAGLAGERSGLWHQFARLVRELRPRYVVVENVSALLDRGMGTVLGDLAESGYDAEWASFPTGRNMGHERERVFIVAHAVREGLPQWSHPYQVRADAPRIFTRQRFASFVEGVDPRQKWADRPLLGRGVHGIPNRVDRIRALGNSIFPRVTEQIFRRIVEAEVSQK
jgi:DNA (cytosine-5)-methyltransferase 1